ncbi:MAG: DNA-processing protein DprA [Clostridia bacterium]|nr:DNA-processing protein DprA [Clostridia bacterium]
MSKKNQELLLWIWLSTRLRPGSALPTTLLKYFGSVQRIYESTEEELSEIDTPFYGHEEDLMDKDLGDAKRILEYCEKNKIGVMTPEDHFYPEGFRALPNRPMVLYYLGNFCDFDNRFTVGVVGCRKPSEYGIHAAKRISYDLARSGAVIVSGMAAGIDAAAHRAALYNESFTVGILGCGIDRVYPKENDQLYEEVIRSGLLLTEYPPGTAPLGRNFPIRNRLIAALADAVCVIEGNEQSGALITAEDALKQGKGLYTVPGSIFARSSSGSNFLLKLGAKPCLSAYDLVEDYRLRYPALKGALPLFGKKEDEPKKKVKKPDIKKKIRGYVFPGKAREEEEKALPPTYDFIMVDEAEEAKKRSEPAASPLPELSPEERQVYGELGYQPVPMDHLITAERSAAELMRIITKLEIKGLVHRAPGGKVVLADRAEA